MRYTLEQIEAARQHLSPSELAELEEYLSVPTPPDSLMEFIPWLTPKFQAPYHLKPFVDELERSIYEPVKVVVSAPPRHNKTETVLHFISKLLLTDPTRQIAYISHTDRLSKTKAGRAKILAEMAGVPISRASSAKHDWRTGCGEGGLWATSRDGGITGLGYHHIFIDDLVKDRQAAESAIEREADWEWFNGTLFSRLEPGGSIFVIMTRWHEDDLSGRLIKKGWKYINLPAISDDGNALCPEQWPVDKLEEIRQYGEYYFLANYQGTPRSKDSRLFDGVYTYSKLPSQMQIAIGVDCAYSERTSADWSVAVVLGQHSNKWYVLDVIRKQCKIEEFAEDLILLQDRYPSSRMRWDASTTERGTASLLRQMGVRNLYTVLAKGKPFDRAQKSSVQWNKGNILLPQRAPWLSEFCDIFRNFNGVGNVHDDDVVALASAFEQLPPRVIGEPVPDRGTEEWSIREAQHMLAQAQKEARARSQMKDRSNRYDPLIGQTPNHLSEPQKSPRSTRGNPFRR